MQKDDNDVRPVGSGANQPDGKPSTPGTGDGVKAAAAADGKGADPKKDDGKEPVRKFFPPPEPDSPLRPHFFNSRAELLVRPPRVLITAEAYKRMSLYIDLARKEVGWQGTVSLLKNGDFLIDQVFLLEQEVTGTETELSVDGRAKLTEELIARGGDEGIEQANRLRFWGHSHVRMSTGPSGTDERTMDQFGVDGFPWAIRGIFNKLGRAEFTIYLFEKGIRILDAPWVVFAQHKGVLLDQPKRFAYRSWGSGGGSYGNGYGGGLRQGGGLFGSSEPAEPPAFTLPEELVPSAELRAQVRIEFAAKVTERKFFRFGKNRDEVLEVEEPEDTDETTQDEQGEPGTGTPKTLVAQPGSAQDKNTPKTDAQPADKQPGWWARFCAWLEDGKG